MKYSLSAQVVKTPEPTVPSVGHDDDQHASVLFGEDLSALKEVSELEDGQPEGATENLTQGINPKAGVSASCGCGGEGSVPPPAVSRVIDADGKATIKIILGPPERNKWLAHVIGLIDSASEKDVVDITIVPNVSGICDTLSHRSLLSAIDRCPASVITRASILSTIGDVVLWLSGDHLQYSKKMTGIFVRQPLAGYGGDIADLSQKGDDAIGAWKEYSEYVAARNLFTKQELNHMFETRGMLSLHGQELEARMANLKQVAD